MVRIKKLALYGEDPFDLEWDELRHAVSVGEDPRVVIEAADFKVLERASGGSTRSGCASIRLQLSWFGRGAGMGAR